jgi:type II restriction-modification system restriction subunit
MTKMTPEESYLFFLNNCTTANKSANNYSDFTRINETIARLKEQPSFDIYSILEVSELDRIIESLKKDEDFLSYNSKGNNQYTNALAYYRRYLLALQLSQATPSKGERSSVPLSLQIIYFGAPGSGKSHKVAEDLAGISRENIFRTTFHPDYDYASFVGCYKPIVSSPSRQDLSFEELKSHIQEEVDKNPDHTISKFTIKYYRSIQKLLETPQRKELRAEIQKCLQRDNDGKAQHTYMNQAIALGEYLEKEGLWRDDSTITYAFTPQVFTNAYVRAWEHPNESIYLIIEEINRGNCAQIFGDLFQLLDRKEDGTSCYPIHADKDLVDYLQRELSEGAKLGIEGGNLCLPSNLHIIATMNTSDQSLFPMDSAFKRRWDWEYIPINYSDKVKSGQFEIVIGKEENQKQYRWIDFLKEINKHILKVTGSEDKQMGNFFIKSSIEEKAFKSKVMAYLWHEVCKDEYGTQSNFFRSGERAGDGEEFSFNQLYDGEINSTKLLQGFMTYLDVRAIGEESAGEENE